MKRTIVKDKEQIFIDKVKRSIKEFQEFSELYRADEADHFDLCIYSQNFSYIINEITKRLNNPDFMEKQSIEIVDSLICFFNYFVQAHDIVEKMRINLSIVKVKINEFIFSEN